jgi:hypothetical protein
MGVAAADRAAGQAYCKYRLKMTLHLLLLHCLQQQHQHITVYYKYMGINSAVSEKFVQPWCTLQVIKYNESDFIVTGNLHT